MRFSSRREMSMAILALISVLSLSVPSAAVAAQIRLVNGDSRCSGRVEVYHYNQWGTVCDDFWDMSEAKVVCRQLGCGTAVCAPKSAFYGEGTGQILMDDVSCSGTEQSLTQCSYLRTHNCGHYEDAGVVCSMEVELRKPRLSSETSKKVSWGQSAQMRCSICTQLLGGTFTLQQSIGSFTETKTAIKSSALFTIPQVDFTHEGVYYCKYRTRVSIREFTSPQSSTISLSVIVVLVQPNISLSAPDGGLFWGPQGPEVTWGHSLSLICSTEPQHQGGSFHLIFDGSNSTRTQLAINHSASFYIPEADYSHQGNYSCVYEVTVSSRTFKSTQTAPLTVIVRGKHPALNCLFSIMFVC
ncbi:neurotrypsin-like [Sardina pilchardus]|uniref:neurotrypsin-like n=1 Tax=Sardina pilchardus TaxID=27697 RepID=UPI002E1015D5